MQKNNYHLHYGPEFCYRVHMPASSVLEVIKSIGLELGAYKITNAFGVVVWERN